MPTPRSSAGSNNVWPLPMTIRNYQRWGAVGGGVAGYALGTFAGGVTAAATTPAGIVGGAILGEKYGRQKAGNCTSSSFAPAQPSD